MGSSSAGSASPDAGGEAESENAVAASPLPSRPSSLLPAEDLAPVILHASDLSAPLCPDFALAYEWSERCNAEFHAQVRERVL